jgi:hypothetical protein
MQWLVSLKGASTCRCGVRVCCTALLHYEYVATAFRTFDFARVVLCSYDCVLGLRSEVMRQLCGRFAYILDDGRVASEMKMGGLSKFQVRV